MYMGNESQKQEKPSLEFLKSRDDIVVYNFRTKLAKAFQERKIKKPSYSFRAFAQFLDIDVSSLRKIISGKRQLGAIVIQKLGTRLGLEQSEIEKYLQAAKLRMDLGTNKVDEIRPVYTVLDDAALRTLFTWESYALHELMDLSTFVPDVGWIAQVLRLDLSRVQQLVNDLEKLGWIEIRGDGKWIRKTVNSSTDPLDDRTAELRRQLMQSILKKSLESLTDVEREKRVLQAQTFAIDAHLLPKAVEKMRAFRVEMNHFLQCNADPDGAQKRNQVYEFTMSLFPLSHIEEGTSPQDE